MAGENGVRARREALGLSQVALARAAGISRQALGAIEAGRATPAVDVALRIASALETAVEALFGTAARPDRLRAEPWAPNMSGRVALARVGARWVAYPLAGPHISTSADGLVRARRKHALVVEPWLPIEREYEPLVVMGCAAALGLLADRLGARPGAGRFLWVPASSTRALESLATHQTHVAGVHLVDGRTGEPDLVELRTIAGSEAFVIVTLARWEAGFLVAPGNPKQIRSAADLGRRALRLVVRELGSGARRLLDRELCAAGLAALAERARLRASGHLEVAQAIALGAADVGVASRDMAIALGLGFVPLAEERYDLVVPRSAWTDPRIERLLDGMTSAPVRDELQSLGYDVRSTGVRVAEVHP